MADDATDRAAKDRLNAAIEQQRDMMREFRRLTKDSEEPVQYQRGQHNAINYMLAYTLAVAKEALGRVKELEARPQAKYVGVWSPNQTYAPGSLATRSGALWHAEIESKGIVPGSATACWRLAVKSGRMRADEDHPH